MQGLLSVCKKCGQVNQSPKFHTHDSPGLLIGVAGNGCSESSLETMDGEHLHYYCQCGYDWIGQTLEQRLEAAE